MPCWSIRWLFLVSIIVAFSPSSNGFNHVAEKFQELLGAIDRVVSYSITHYDEMNLDGAFGLWITKGYLTHLLSTHALWHDSNGNKVLNSANAILTRLKNSIEMAIPNIIKSVKEHDEVYFERLGFLFNLHWFPQPVNDLFGQMYSSKQSTSNVKFNEQLSDQCVSQLLLSNSTKRRCQPSEDCLEILTGQPSNGYGLTHQVLYAIVLVELDCTRDIGNRLDHQGHSLFTLTLNLCSHAFDELISLLKLTPLSPKEQDLLMEQIFVCSHLGFVQFNQLSLLDLILSWQHPSGCFTDQSKQQSIHITGRQILEEHRLSDGCLSHMTSVATAALLSFLRRFLVTNLSGERPETDMHRILLQKEHIDQNKFLPKLLEQSESNRPPAEQSWEPLVPFENLKRLSGFHWISQGQTATYSPRSTALNPLSMIDVEMETSTVFYCLSLFSLALCLLFYIRVKRRYRSCS